ncbi:hypothetical protein [Streptomyces violaceus]|uniref:Uncharacterized protein n=1 Tax=Streptomyces violaceus TaxID=1936 RepID=A0ABY9UMD7_STRVL|nr:hypothetical protein [Streptomyces janthinus]WND24069.1 hypothetical protein RI060_42885 [Streptomyces janthinus]GGS96441.1 hypothetical protein GCM10010270_80520 [Streptomyces janthinus]
MTTDRIPVAHSVVYAVRGVPEVPDEYNAERTIAPHEITLTYRAAEDSQLGRVHAYVKGWWMQDGSRVPMDKPVGRHFWGRDFADWPEWLAAEARLHDPDDTVHTCPGRWGGPDCRCFDDEAQPGTEAYPPQHRWRVELFDYLAEEWVPGGTRYPERNQAMERCQAMREKAPVWKDGPPVQRRVVRETTTYTVETEHMPVAEAQQDGARS